MEEPILCHQCGEKLQKGPLGDLCPKCLVKAGLASGASLPDGIPTTQNAAGPGFEPPPPEALAELFPHLEIIRLLGRGGMGAVYQARQKSLDRMVALKILPPELGQDPSFAERFTREARALAKLGHPHIVGVFDFGQAGELFFILMEFVHGTNLRHAIQAGQIAPKQALEIVSQVCEALQFAHNEGIVHRDIKPENILIDAKGRVKIADFGLSKIVDSQVREQNLTGTHQVMGTRHYMAPEQMQGSRQVDHRADIYSLGVVFYELLTGNLPMGRFPLPSQRVQVDVRLDEVVLRTLEHQPEQRYQHASDVKSDVESISAREKSGVAAAPPCKNPKETTYSPTSESQTPPRFSWKAIVGACWAPFFLLLVPTTMLVTYKEMVDSREMRDRNQGIGNRVEVGNGVTILRRENPPNGSNLSTSKELMLLAIILVPLGVSAPFGTTILGGLAISDIRHSQGRIVGMPLAVIDLLLYPLIIFDILIGFFWYMLFQAGIANYDRAFTLAIAMTLLTIVVSNFWILKKTWELARSL